MSDQVLPCPTCFEVFWWPFLLYLCLVLGPYFRCPTLCRHYLFSSASVADHLLLVLEILSLLHSSPAQLLGKGVISILRFASGCVRAAGGGWTVLLLSWQPLWGHPRQCLFLDLPLPSTYCFSKFQNQKEILIVQLPGNLWRFCLLAQEHIFGYWSNGCTHAQNFFLQLCL